MRSNAWIGLPPVTPRGERRIPSFSSNKLESKATKQCQCGFSRRGSNHDKGAHHMNGGESLRK